MLFVFSGLNAQAGEVASLKPHNDRITVGAARTSEYLPTLEGKRVAVVANQTSVFNGAHLVDVLLAKNVQLKKVFAPEHGFRGTADAGELLQDGTDRRSGLPVVSLYGKNKKPTATQLADVDVVLFDIQDVGARFYTYISTMHYVMEACAENGKILVVLDRPNPNGFYVDGPVLEREFASFVGMHAVPIVHGMTVGEYAQMINGEGWLNNGVECQLSVVECTGYDHSSIYHLPVPPSPNLPNHSAVQLYPSLCLFEGTPVSVGRGTDKQFQVVGMPGLSIGTYSFTPRSSSGAKQPKHEGVACIGFDLSQFGEFHFRNTGQMELLWLLEIFGHLGPEEQDEFFTPFFDKLAGSAKLREQIVAGRTAEQIRASWQEELKEFKAMRAKYLLYPDF